MGAVLDLHAAGRRDAGDRGERRLRQSSDLRRDQRGAVGRQFPRRAGGVRGRYAGACRLRDRLARRAAHRHADRPGAVGAAGVPYAAARAQFRVHGGAGDGGGAGVREQAARLSRERRFDPDLGQPGGSCVDGGAWRVPARRDGGERHQCGCDRAAGSGAGLRLSCADALERAARARARGPARRGAELDHDRYLAPDIAAAAALVRSGAIAAAPEIDLPDIEGTSG